jgi:hypothetical protein
MHRVYVAQDVKEAKAFLEVLQTHDIHGRIIEDQDFPERGELHDADAITEVWIAESDHLDRAKELALEFEDRRLHGGGGAQASEG